MTSPTATTEIERLAREAEQNKWWVEKTGPSGHPSVRSDSFYIAHCIFEEDAAYIAAVSPDVVLGMIAEHNALKKEMHDWNNGDLAGVGLHLDAALERAEKAEAALRAAEAERDGLVAAMQTKKCPVCKGTKGFEDTTYDRTGSWVNCHECDGKGEVFDIRRLHKARAALQSTSAKEGES